MQITQVQIVKDDGPISWALSHKAPGFQSFSAETPAKRVIASVNVTDSWRAPLALSLVLEPYS